jgi:hypothetical protein
VHDCVLVQEDVLGELAVRGHAEPVELVLGTGRSADPVRMAGRADAVADLCTVDILSDGDRFARVVLPRYVVRLRRSAVLPFEDA